MNVGQPTGDLLCLFGESKELEEYIGVNYTDAIQSVTDGIGMTEGRG